MKFKIKCWIPVDVEDEEDTIYDSEEEVRKDLDSMELMQPENIYEIVEIEENE